MVEFIDTDPIVINTFIEHWKNECFKMYGIDLSNLTIGVVVDKSNTTKEDTQFIKPYL